MAMKAISFKVEGNEVQLPSQADLVAGLDDAIDAHITAYDNATVDAKIADLSNVYLGKSAKAADSAKADYATSAGKATNDGSGNAITLTYYKKSDTVDRAAADDQGNNFREKYALKTGTVANASYATTAGASNSATLDSGGNNINATYIKEITASGQTVTYKRGNNTTGTFTTKDTTYNAATTTTAGLMSAADKKKLDALSTDTGSYSVASAGTATKLATARTISIGGGASGTASFDGSADAKISLGSINAASITSGTLAVARGGTGQTALSNVTVGKASKLETARTVALKGAVTGSTTFDGSANVTIATSALDVSTATAGTLAVARGGTGQTTLALARNAMGLGNTTGALPIANGGTGLTASPSMLTNLASASAANIMAASPRPGVTGTLGVGNGGTGQTSLANVTVGKADQLTTARTIKLAGAVAGSALFNGTGDITINNTIQTTVSLANATFTNVALTGDVAGTGSISNNTLSIKTTLSHSAFQSVLLEPSDYNNDLNNATNPGYYRVNWLPSWNHRPTGARQSTHYLNILKSGSSSACIQQLFEGFNNHVYYRCLINGTWYPWKEYNTTEVGTYEAEES